jgi:hypothetical protein
MSVDYGRTPSDTIKVVQSLEPQVANNETINGTGVDCLGWDAALVVVNVGVIGSTSLTVKLQESSDDGSSDAYADITDATTGAIATADDQSVYIMDVNTSEVERYLRAVAISASAADDYVGAVFCLMSGRHLPPTQAETVVQVGYDQLA